MLEGYCASTETAPGQWQGLFYKLHPTPSGWPRHILFFSDNRRFPTAEEAASEMQAAIDRINARQQASEFETGDNNG